jgi:hypothetical protein
VGQIDPVQSVATILFLSAVDEFERLPTNILTSLSCRRPTQRRRYPNNAGLVAGDFKDNGVDDLGAVGTRAYEPI